MSRPERGSRWRERLAASREFPPGGRTWFLGPRNLRILALVALLVLTLFAIWSLQRPFGEERRSILLTPFRAGPGGPDAAFLDRLTDRVAARISRLPWIEIVLLSRDSGEESFADLHLAGVVEREEGGFLVRMNLRAIPDGPSRLILVRTRTDEEVPGLANEVVRRLEETLQESSP